MPMPSGVKAERRTSIANPVLPAPCYSPIASLSDSSTTASEFCNKIRPRFDISNIRLFIRKNCEFPLRQPCGLKDRRRFDCRGHQQGKVEAGSRTIMCCGPESPGVVFHDGPAD